MAASGKIRRALLYAGAAVIGLVLLTYLTPLPLSLVYHDIGQLDNDIFQSAPIAAAKPDNAFISMKKIAGPVDLPREDSARALLSGTSWDAGAAAAIISKNRRLINIIDEAASKPAYANTDVLESTEAANVSAIPDVSQWNTAAELASLRALSSAKAGDLPTAIRQVFIPIELADKMQRSEPVLIEYLVAEQIKTTGLSTLRAIIEGSRLTAAEHASILRRLDRLTDPADALAAGYKGEYRYFLQTVDLDGRTAKGFDPMFSGGPGFLFTGLGRERFYFQPNRTRKLIVDNFNRLVARHTASCAKEPNFEDATPPQKSLTRMLITPNSLGELIGSGSWQGAGPGQRRCETEALIASIRSSLIARIKPEKTRSVDTKAELNGQLH